MDADAIIQAEARLEKARRALNFMLMSSTAAGIESGWEDYVLAVSSFYSKLEQGTKGCGTSEAWFGRKKRERKTDPLLLYLHQARNSDQHRLARIVGRTSSHVTLPPGARVRFGCRTNGVWTAVPEQGEIEFASDLGKLIRVHNRHGGHCDPPTHHLGLALADRSPAAIAYLGVDYIVSMLQEAKAL